MRALLPILALIIGFSLVEPTLAAEGNFPISEDGAMEGGVTVAYDSNHDRFLTAWADFRNKGTTDLDIYGRIVDPEGNPVSGDIPIAQEKRGQSISALAFDPLGDRFLVVWTDWRNASAVDSDIYGQFVGADGALVGDNFPIAQRRVSQKYPAVAFDPVHRQFLVVWAETRDKRTDKVYGRYVDSEGKLVGSEFIVAPEGDNQDRPSVTFDENRKRFFVVWRDSDAVGIYAAFVDPARPGPGPRILVAGEEEWGCLPPSLYATAFAPDHDVFFVVWTSGRNYWQQGLDVYGAFVNGDGTLRGPPIAVAAEFDYQEYPAVAFDPNSDRFLVVWYDLRRDTTALNMDIYGRFVASDGTLAREFLISDVGTPGVRRFPALSFSPKSGRFLALWEDGRSRKKLGRQIYGAVR